MSGMRWAPCFLSALPVGIDSIVGTADNKTGLEDTSLGVEGPVVDELGGGVKDVAEGMEENGRCDHLLFGGLSSLDDRFEGDGQLIS